MNFAGLFSSERLDVWPAGQAHKCLVGKKVCQSVLQERKYRKSGVMGRESSKGTKVTENPQSGALWRAH